MRRGVYQKVAAVVVFIIIVTMVVPYMVFSHTSRKKFNTIVQEQIVSGMLGTIDYLESHGRPLSDVGDLYMTGVVSMTAVDRLDGIELTGEQRAKLDSEERTVVFAQLDSFPRQFVAIARSGSSYVLCRFNLSDIFQQMRSAGFLSLLVSVLLGTGGMLFASHRMTRSLRELDAATRKVAAGDFSQRVPLRRTNGEFSTLIESFNTMTEELGSVEMLRSNFISDISHEFKTPLTAIEGYAKLLEDEEDDTERREYVQIITEETGRLSTLADNILMLNRIEKGNIPARKAPVRIDEQIRRALALCESKWEAKRLNLELELDEITLDVYDVLLMQLWTNLVDNAVKFSPPDGEIMISLHRTGERVTFAITDQGPGIPPGQQDHIFEKFYKADRSRGGDGNGLGLSIVRRVAQLHGGEVRVQSAPGEGSTFLVLL
ncbi:HAMP domain-containing sensor histidine kinase [Anaerotruncus rubiinfantis]|jgi:signal transduction histidine kinase|uniref:HAMP domain-containing sensor histidine kinase n=1 Tax=Anaerotruncus rubiinfantis TaxID=1720200 RepID=UPI0009AD7132|nr:HAMP domain-containing sensor histidine kinase [Anaerotruncus rubiinfantis]